MAISWADLNKLFKGWFFEQEIIIRCVRGYLRFKLSFRDLVEMMAERGLSLAHTVILNNTKLQPSEDLNNITEPDHLGA